MIRCTDRNRDVMISILERAKGIDKNVELVPVLTSGSICKVKERVIKDVKE